MSLSEDSTNRQKIYATGMKAVNLCDDKKRIYVFFFRNF